MRLIDADSLTYRRKDYCGYDDVSDEERKRGILFLLKEDIISAQTVDPVKHGKWISVPNNQNRICSICKYEEPFRVLYEEKSLFDYCPHCGTRMDEE